MKRLRLKRRYSVLFGLTYNLLAIIQVNIYLIHDSLKEETIGSSFEKDNYLWISSAQKWLRIPEYLDLTEMAGVVHKK